MVGKVYQYTKGEVLMRDIEWTDGSVPLHVANRDKAKRLWHIGKAGKEIFLHDFITERSYVLYEGY